MVVFVEVHCSDSAEHRRRLESRERNIPGFAEPTWASVTASRTAFDDWADPRVRVDSMAPHETNVAHVLEGIACARSVSR
nr:hypothetical protein [Rhodococcus sp. (in: high G+C Gram-positive bacteria)]